MNAWLAGTLGAVLIGVVGALAWELRRREELIARACHELRGPLTAARLALQCGVRTPEPALQHLEAVELELQRVTLALDDLLSARRGRRGVDRCDAVDVAGLVAQQGAAWRIVARARGTRLRVRQAIGVPVVRGDRVRLAQAVGNLLANALEHGSGRVELAVRQHGDRVHIDVADQGEVIPGSLPPAIRHRQRRRTSGRQERGHGLAVASEIAERHGGRLLAVTAQRGAGGTRLRLELPLGDQR